MINISVIIPVYNCEKYIGRCIESLLNQGLVCNLEIVAVNDGSTDDSLAVLKRYNDVKIIDIPNGGVANARNVGLCNAIGDYIMFVDADDYIKPNALSVLVNNQKNTDADIVRFRYELVYDKKESYIPTDCQISKYGLFNKSEFAKDVYPLFFDGIFLNSVCMAMFKRTVLENVLFREDMKTAEDAVFSLYAYTNARTALFLEDVLYCYNQTDSGLTSNGLNIFQKYKDNYIFAFETLKLLKMWGIRNINNICRVMYRPVKITFDKIKREKIRNNKGCK